MNKLIVEVREEAGYFSVYVNDRRLVDRESYAIADRIRWYLEHPEKWDRSECWDVANSIRTHLESQNETNPM